ncbi:Ig-like domain-containing protein [Oceanirhabdus seepicola]|uniref:Ig-like domain-containing protein n=1 Tax=Oceanirhabdus seepicola TaxID=2828781 RepID=A0A9J6P0Q3_9CLOT|nr:Ig-like domain-containing protein [Oceanirhabdus seepicola]MCM1989485.1 Ig-like domain-containing protein [Oceanirhabdus seepicola]
MKKIMRMSFLMLLMISMLQVNVFAGGGNGGGKSALKLESSTPANKGDIGVDESIKLKFSNNVVNMKVAENNKTCFKLVDADGNELPIKVVMGDDQVNKDIKNDIEIVPVKSLEEGQTYKLIIDGKLEAKNGSKLKDEKIVTFKTEGSGGFPVTTSVGIAILFLVIVGILAHKNKKS